MGTTIMAVKYDGGVIACADSSTIFIYSGTSAGGSYTVDRVADKIDFVHDHIIVLRSGAAGQSQQTAHKVRFLVDSHVVEQGKLPHVKTAARMFQKMNYEKQLETGYIVAGWDPYEGPQVYSVNLGGATLLRNYTMGGSGSGFIYGYCDANFKEGMSFE
jgi:20S proteasome subunit beta 1